MTYLNDAPDWDVVCYLDPYSLPSQRLPQYVPAVGSGARYIPEDEWIDEEEYGFAFIDRDTLTVSIFELDKLKVYRIIGPQCVSRATARFRTDKIDAPNLDYIRMTIIGTL